MEQASFNLFAADPDAEPAAVAEVDATLSVLELVTRMREGIRAAIPGDVWVRGEVQNLKRSQNGHTYFTLVEKSGGRGDQARAKIDVTLFRDDRRAVERAIKEVPGAELGNDVEVRICGRIELYAPQGRVQVIMTAIDPVFTVGGIAAGRERVLRALAADGILEVNGRVPMPLVPVRVGLVTSAGSAAYHDFVQELATSGYAFEVGVVDVRVQGAAASKRIMYGLRQMALRDLDVVVVVRGGGSRADLAPFDADDVARLIAAMPVPVITGVGHETDRSVADEVAHTSCKTPTACAQLLVARVRTFEQQLAAASHRVVSRARARTAMARRELDEATRRVQRGLPAALAREHAQVERHHGRLDELARLRLRDASRVLDDRSRRVPELTRTHLRHAARDLDECVRRTGELSRARLRESALVLDTSAATVRALDPRRVLDRGYSITRDEHGRAVRRADDVAVGAIVHTELADGALISRIEAIDASDDSEGNH
ncbi:MAG: exodeoxyribonuclease VII large subunit [Acidimicrobiia bacterium]